MSKDILGNDIEELNVCNLINALGINRAFARKVKETEQLYCKLLDKHNPGFSEEIKKTLEANPGGQEDDNPQQDRDSQATLPRENSQGERNGENNHNKKHRDSNPGRQEHDNPQQGKGKKKNPDSLSTAPRENRKGERNGENNHNKKHRTPHQNADTTVNTNSITTLGENIKQKLQRNKRHIVPALIALLTLSLGPSVCNRSSSLVKDNKKVTTEQKDPIKRDSESETIDKVSTTGELSHFVKEGESMYSIVTNLKSSGTLSGIPSVREDIIRVACEKGFIMKIKEGQTTKGKFDPRDLSPGDVIVIKIKEFESLHRQ
ncbi:hypothetical protein D8B45_07585 [Candidatus Gracilibacteria bacterium]|nr:MAG: hypothetical protein D8B45_07585 [Candidatus Gracilibacteria bacterium]